MAPSREVYMYLVDPAKLREWRNYRDLSLGELAQAVGVSKQFISQLENGTKRTSKPKTAKLIEKFLLPPASKRAPADGPLFVARYSGNVGVVSETVGDA